jgi:hypothetical protein
MFAFATVRALRRLFSRAAILRKGKPRRNGPRARLKLESLEDRCVPTVAGFSFVEQQGFPGPLTTLVSQPTGLADQLVSTYTALRNGTQQINGQTLDQLVQAQVRQMAQGQGYTAYNISDSFSTPEAAGWGAVYDGNYTASLDTSGANPVVHMHYYLPSNTLDFTLNNMSKDGWPGFMDASFHVDYSMTLNVDVTFPSALSSQATVSTSATTVVNGDTVSTHNWLVWLDQNVFGKNMTGQIADQIAGNTQTLPGLVDTGTINALLQGEAAKGYSHLHAGLDGSGNLVLTAQQSNLVVNGSYNDDITLETGTGGTVKVFAGGQWGTFDAGYLQQITINSGGGSSQINIEGVPAGVSVQVNGASNSSDRVMIGDSLSLTSIAGPVSLNYSNGSGKAAVTVDDYWDSAARNVNITSSSVQFSNLPTISYSGNITNLAVWGSSGSDNYHVSSTPSPLWLVPGKGQNHINIGAHTGSYFTLGESLSGIAGTVTVSGDIYGGQDYLTIDDLQGPASNLTLTSSTVSFSGVPTIYYSGLTGLNVVMPYGANKITVNGVAQGTAATIYNTASDTVWGPAAWQAMFVTGLPPWDQWSGIIKV